MSLTVEENSNYIRVKYKLLSLVNCNNILMTIDYNILSYHTRILKAYTSKVTKCFDLLTDGY